ncbi:MAG: SPOR domain-containing protein [Deltaproteobacteria bacterium]
MSNRPRTDKARVVKVFIAFMVLFIIVFSLGVFVGKGLRKEEIRIATKFQEREQPVPEIPFEEDEEPEPESVIAYSDSDTDSEKENGLEEEAPEPSPSPEATPRPEVGKSDVREAAPPDKAVSPPEAETEARLAEITEEIRRERERERTESEQKGRTGDVALPPIDPKGLYTVQIGSFQNQKQANSLASSLKSKGYPVFIKAMTTPDNENWYRVRVGTFGDIETAKKYGEGLKTMEPAVNLVFITVNN